MQYMMLTLSALLVAMDIMLNKVYQKMRGTSVHESLFFNSILGLSIAFIFFIVNKFNISILPYSVFIAMAMGALTVINNTTGFYILKQGSIAIYSMFLLTGGMILPYVWGLIFFDEPLKVVRIIGLVVIIGGVFLSNFSGEKINLKHICLCIFAFVLSGMANIISKMHQIEANYECVGTVDFVILYGLFRSVIAGFLLLVLKNRNEQRIEKNKLSKSLFLIILSAVFCGLSFFLQLYGSKSLPATVLFPFLTGGSLVFSVLLSSILFKEKLTRRLIISVVLCFVGTIMFV